MLNWSKRSKNEKRAEERLRQLSLELDRGRALLKSLIDSIPDVIFYKDRESIYLGGNPALRNWLVVNYQILSEKQTLIPFRPMSHACFEEERSTADG